MRKTILAATILAAASSFAVAQTTSPTTHGGVVNEGAASTSGTMSKPAKHTGKHMKSSSKKSDKSSTPTGSSGTTGTTGTTAAGTADQTTSGATKPAGDPSMSR